MFVNSALFRCVLWGLSAFGVFLSPQLAFAQPDETPRTIRQPQPGGLFREEPPQPPAITVAELETLLGGPTLVTYSGRDVSLDVVMKALAEAGHFPILPSPALDRAHKITVDWQQVPFWAAAQEIEEKIDATWSGADDNALTLMPQSRRGFYGILGADTPLVRIVADLVTRSADHTMPLGGPKDAPAPLPFDDIRIHLSTYFDPKLKVLLSWPNLLSWQVQGAEVPVVNPDPLPKFSFFTTFIRPNRLRNTSLPLPSEVRPGNTLASVKGFLRTIIIANSTTWNVPDLGATPKSTHLANETQMNVESVEIQNGNLTIQLSATGLPTVSQNQLGVAGNLHVRDAQGFELRASSSSISGGNANGRSRWRGQYKFDLNPLKGVALQAPFSLEWRIATELRSFDVPFELRDIAVP